MSEPDGHRAGDKRRVHDRDSEDDNSDDNLKEFDTDDLATPGSPAADETDEDPSDWSN